MKAIVQYRYGSTDMLTLKSVPRRAQGKVVITM